MGGKVLLLNLSLEGFSSPSPPIALWSPCAHHRAFSGFVHPAATYTTATEQYHTTDTHDNQSTFLKYPLPPHRDHGFI